MESINLHARDYNPSVTNPQALFPALSALPGHQKNSTYDNFI
jgi:hypothetical protein